MVVDRCLTEDALAIVVQAVLERLPAGSLAAHLTVTSGQYSQ